MKNVWKFLLCLAVALPMITYVAGALSATRHEAPQPEQIVLRPTNASPTDLSDSNPGRAQQPRTLEIKPKPEVISRFETSTAQEDSGGDETQPAESPGAGEGNGSSGEEDDQPNGGSDTDSENGNPDEDSDKDDERDEDSDEDDDDADPDEGDGEDNPDESDESDESDDQ